MDELFLPGVPANQIKQAFASAPGKEISGGNFARPVSSAALAANAFGFFLNRPGDIPLPPECDGETVCSLSIETPVRFPWIRACHPWLDVLIVTDRAFIGVESKRFEPFQQKRSPGEFRESHRWPKWGDNMKGYERIRDQHPDKDFSHLDVAQLVKHAFALRTERQECPKLRPVLWYLYAEPECWPKDARLIPDMEKRAHRKEIARFAEIVAADEVRFLSCSYRDLLAHWSAHGLPDVRDHAGRVLTRFSP